ncbi:MAG: deoxyribonuclease IV [Patescibacteria group bacterium]
MKFGAHVSASGGLWNAPEAAAALGCECFQFFTRSPQGGTPAPITAETISRFKDACARFGFSEWYVHAPYFINLASAEERIRVGSIRVLREELARATKLGVKYLMTHLGSAKDVGKEAGVALVVSGITKILEGYNGSCQFLIEVSAGAGAVIGDRFEEIAEIVTAVEANGHAIGICFDTQHAFASGYDLRTPEALDETLAAFDRTVGLRRLKMSHCNDSKVELGARKDRHEHIGAGAIGLEGFRLLVNHPKLADVNLIIETPFEGQLKDLENLKALRSLKKS